MTKAILPDGRQAIYKYDAFGRRIKKTITDKSGHQKTTEFLWQGDNLIAETDNKEHYQSYIYEPNSFKPLALIVGRGKEHKVYHYQLDHIGTPTDLTDTKGNAVWSAQYLAYGTIYTQHTEEVTNPLRFQGQYFDQETGLHYNRHRYYNPKNGLFTTADPIGLAGGLNNYQYVKNPTGFVDPLGLKNVDGSCACGSTPSKMLPDFENAGEPEVAKLLYGNRMKEGLPGAEGIPISGRPSVQELENLTAKHNVEFSVVYQLGAGPKGAGGQYFLYSGDIKSVKVPTGPDKIWIAHTHPSGTAFASNADLNVMTLLHLSGSPQKKSMIVPVGSEPTWFTKDTKSTGK